MRVGVSDFNEVWFADFEFVAVPGSRPTPVCVVALELESGRSVRIWTDELMQLRVPPYSTSRSSLVVAYYASAEIDCDFDSKPIITRKAGDGSKRYATVIRLAGKQKWKKVIYSLEISEQAAATARGQGSRACRQVGSDPGRSRGGLYPRCFRCRSIPGFLPQAYLAPTFWST